MVPALLLIILKGRCFISCECQISAIYIPQLPHTGEWLSIHPEMNGSGHVELKSKRQKEEEEEGLGGKLADCFVVELNRKERELYNTG